MESDKCSHNTVSAFNPLNLVNVFILHSLRPQCSPLTKWSMKLRETQIRLDFFALPILSCSRSLIPVHISVVGISDWPSCQDFIGCGPKRAPKSSIFKTQRPKLYLFMSPSKTAHAIDAPSRVFSLSVVLPAIQDLYR